MIKSEIRSQMKLKKQKLSSEEITTYSEEICQRLRKQIDLGSYDALYTYVSFNEEVQTTSLIEYALSKNLKLAVPKIINKAMEFYYIQGLDELKTGFHNILEPVTSQIAKDNHILMIMPGLAFDTLGNRIGYGAGYYDKYLKEKEEVIMDKIAFAYDFQILEELEVDEYDIKVDQIVTPTRWIHRRRN